MFTTHSTFFLDFWYVQKTRTTTTTGQNPDYGGLRLQLHTPGVENNFNARSRLCSVKGKRCQCGPDMLTPQVMVIICRCCNCCLTVHCGN